MHLKFIEDDFLAGQRLDPLTTAGCARGCPPPWLHSQSVSESRAEDSGLPSVVVDVLAHREQRNNLGYAAREELGICGAFGYVYSQDARPDYQLVLMSVAQAETQRQSFAQPVQEQIPGTIIVTAS